MKIIKKKIQDLKPYKNNPRFNDSAVDAVAESIDQFGFVQPVVIDKDNVIVIGHTRVKALKQLGVQTVECTVADLPPDKIRALRLADNKIGELADWDLDALAVELDGIESIDMSDFGFEMPDDIFEIENDVGANTTKQGQYDKKKMPVNIGALLLFLSPEEQEEISENFGVFYADGINDDAAVAEIVKKRMGELADEIRDMLPAD